MIYHKEKAKIDNLQTLKCLESNFVEVNMKRMKTLFQKTLD